MLQSVGLRRGMSSSSAAGGSSVKLWGGRFSKDTDTSAVGWAESLTCDEEMIKEDIWGSIAHVSMLGHQGIVPAKEAASIVKALAGFQDGYAEGKLDFFDPKFSMHDDVHMNTEARLIDALGMEVGGKMHTTRSRNDQVPVSSKLRTRNLLLDLRAHVIEATQSFMDRAEEDGATQAVMPAYTHFQHAQPVSISFWMSHYAAVLERDLQRIKRAYDVTDENPLGGGAISGTSFPTDRSITTDLLGFQSTMTHSLDATGSRDFMLEVLGANATLHSTWSRLAEELIMWSSYEFRTVTIDDGFAMGSSMMPQKKNPGTLELLRGRAGIQYGHMMAGYTMLKGLPSGYNRDFHKEKELLFASMRMANRSAAFVPNVVRTTTFNKTRMKELCDKNFMTATELANYLVAEHDVPFRATHHIVGSLVGKLTASGDNLTNLPAVMAHLAENGVQGAKEADVRRVLDPQSVMMTYDSYGGTSPKAMKVVLAEINEKLNKHRADLATDKARVESGFNACRAIAAEADMVKTLKDLQDLVAKHRPAHTPKQ